jgi:hypothetical protein
MFLASVDAEDSEREMSAELKAWEAVTNNCIRGDIIDEVTWAEFGPECEKKSGCT